MPILESVSEILSTNTFPPILSLPLQYRLCVLQSSYYLAVGSATSIKKTVSKLQHLLPAFSDFLPSLSIEFKNERLRDFTNPNLFLLSQASPSVFDYNPLCIRGMLDYHRGNYKKIISLSTDPSFLFLLGSCEFALGHYSTALVYYRMLLQQQTEVSPLLGRIYKNLALVYLADEQIENSLKCIAIACSILPSNPSLEYYHVFIQMHQSQDKWNVPSLLSQIQAIEEGSLEESQRIQLMLWKIQLFRHIQAFDEVCEQCKILLQKPCSFQTKRPVVLSYIQALCSLQAFEEALEICRWQEEFHSLQEEFVCELIYNRVQVGDWCFFLVDLYRVKGVEECCGVCPTVS